mmetsp:Transcript_115872/g.368420  ORF Transcript_115872/g.368420 Transcript_115872/m.368420 type:complete len:132 (-) Transcript_115872:47-442(-)
MWLSLGSRRLGKQWLKVHSRHRRTDSQSKLRAQSRASPSHQPRLFFDAVANSGPREGSQDDLGGPSRDRWGPLKVRLDASWQAAAESARQAKESGLAAAAARNVADWTRSSTSALLDFLSKSNPKSGNGRD